MFINFIVLRKKKRKNEKKETTHNCKGFKEAFA